MLVRERRIRQGQERALGRYQFDCAPLAGVVWPGCRLQILGPYKPLPRRRRPLRQTLLATGPAGGQELSGDVEKAHLPLIRSTFRKRAIVILRPALLIEQG